MSAKDKRLFVSVLMLVGSLYFAAIWRIFTHRRTYAEPVILPLRREAVLRAGDTRHSVPAGKYTLVEFGDYQCPPCRYADVRRKALLSNFPVKITFVFRNLPLTRIHPQALSAALAAESAARQGRFWEMHDALFAQRGELNRAVIDSLESKLHLDKVAFHRDMGAVARRMVDEDIATAKKCGVPGTPTFVLCCPDGRVVRLGDLDQLNRFSDEHGRNAHSVNLA